MMRDVGLELSREVPASQGRGSIVEICEFNLMLFLKKVFCLCIMDLSVFLALTSNSPSLQFLCSTD